MPCKNADTLNQSKTKFYSLELIIAYSRLNDRNITKQIMKSRQKYVLYAIAEILF